jgi:hypothetical protein
MLEYDSDLWDDTRRQVQLLANVATERSRVGDVMSIVIAGDFNVPPAAPRAAP